jgi:hypothetical protein
MIRAFLISAFIIGPAIRFAWTWIKYKRLGLITGKTRGQRFASYIRTASMEIDMKRAHKQARAEQELRNRRR